MKFFKTLFFGGKPMVESEASDRATDEVSYDLTPERINQIMAAANSGDVRDQVQLAAEILEKNADIIQAFNTRRDAVTGLPWHIEPGNSEISRSAAKKLEDVFRTCGGDTDTFEDMLHDMLGAILPGFAVSEILWLPGGDIAGFRSIPQRHFTFREGDTPLLITTDEPMGVELPRQRIIYHKRRFHGSDPCRGGLIRPLAWLHCFKHVAEKDLLGFVERHGMPFIAAKVDPASFDKEKSMIKRLVRNFGSSGGGVFTHNVELSLLESRSDGAVYFQLLKYLDAAVNKVILGQTASSGDASGWSKGDAQSQVRQDILEADCRVLQRLVDTQIIKPWMQFNYGTTADLPHFVIDCAPAEDKEKIAAVVKTLHDAGFETDPQEISTLVGLKLTRKALTDTAAFAAEDAQPPTELTEWLNLSDLSDPSDLSDIQFGDSSKFEETIAKEMVKAYNEGLKDGSHH